jgi:hypothetical protein
MRDFIKLSLKYTAGIGIFFGVFTLVFVPLPLQWRNYIEQNLPIDLADKSIFEYLSQFPMMFILLIFMSFFVIIVVKAWTD